MAWTTPQTWTNGEALTASKFNAQIRDNLQMVGGTDNPHFRYKRTTTQSITGGADEATVVVDTEMARVGFAAPASGVFTVPAGGDGFYFIAGSVDWEALNATNRWVGIIAAGVPVAVSRVPATSTPLAQSVAGGTALTAGQTIQLLAFSGTTVNIAAQAIAGHPPVGCAMLSAFWVCR